MHRTFGDDWPDVSDAALLADPDRWWDHRLSQARSRADLARIDATTIVRALLDHRHAAQLDQLAPERIEVPSGSRIAVDYSTDQPVLAVKVQEVFGWTATPTVAYGRLPVVLHLLSPAGRPAAVTADLTSFWATAIRRCAPSCGAAPQARMARRSSEGADETSARTGMSRICAYVQ